MHTDYEKMIIRHRRAERWKTRFHDMCIGLGILGIAGLAITIDGYRNGRVYLAQGLQYEAPVAKVEIENDSQSQRKGKQHANASESQSGKTITVNGKHYPLPPMPDLPTDTWAEGVQAMRNP